MKKISQYFIVLASILLLVVSCQEETETFGAINTPVNLVVNSVIEGVTIADPYGDGSGKVNFVATAENAISYKYIFSDGTSLNSPSGVLEYRFKTNGIIEYTITVLASGKGGVITSTSFNLTVFTDFSDEQAITFLTGGSSKKWYWSAGEQGHLGVGQNNNDNTGNYYANYYQAAPFEKAASTDSDCLYENELTFSLDNGELKYELDNGGRTFFNNAYKDVGGGTTGGDDLCLAFPTAGLKTVSLSPSESFVASTIPAETRGTMLNFSDNGFMGYYIGQSSYEILSITENRLYVRAVMGNNPALAWYHIFTTTPPTQNPPTDYTNLVWFDEFDTDGAPDATKWGYDLGAGGWGNNEAQTYTNAAANATVTGGNLVIKAIRTGPNTYTSARLKTENKYEFTYGKVEVRAKLPSGGGTWPAIWMLGANYDTVSWPACGEIDIMEYVGNNPDVVLSTLHFPGNSGGNGVTGSTTVSGASTQFHVYKAVWSPSSIRFYVDDVLFHSMPNNSSIPFNSDFFLILNVAMGGNLGGVIDPSFTQSAMEIDYVRVYQ